MKHSTPEALGFLQRLAPAGPWVLTAIVPDGKSETRTFQVGQEADLMAWVQACQGKRNVYYHLNPVLRPLSSKAKKEDIAAMAWLHVDVDPRVGEDINEERERALRLLQEFKPAATVIVDSGGGYQALWKLQPDERLVFNGDLERAAELEAYNIQLEKLFQADRCHNIDRILRLPGTINLPNAAKLKKGRVACPTRLVSWDKDAVYSLDTFTPAVRVQTKEAGLAGGQPRVRISGNVERLSGTDELRERWPKVGDHAMALIVQGEDPIDPTRYPSRSEMLFRVCCDLIRADVPDEVVFSIITDPNFAISKSVTDKPNAERYALRQIERAKEEAVDPWLRKLNEKHAVISDMGGKCRIISEVFDAALKRPKISRQSFDDFRNRYRNARVQVGTKDGQVLEKPVGSWWIDHPQRRQYETITFAPGREVNDAYNLWKGFACDALPGNKHQSLLNHIRQNLCGNNEVLYRYLICWMARAVQQPDTQGETAVVLRGKRGSGKSFAVKAFGSLFGRHFLQVSNAQHLVGNFNAHLRDAVVVFGDEAFYAGDKKHESVLKTLITEETIIIEGKGVDAEVSPNFTHVMMASNAEWVVPAGLDERRFLVLDVRDDHAKDHAYFKTLKAELDGGGRENLLHFLMTLDLAEFEVRQAPDTAALQDQKLLSMAKEEQWFYEKLQEGRLLPSSEGWTQRLQKDDLYEDYLNELRNQGVNQRMGKTAFGKFLSRSLPGAYPISKQEQGEVKILQEGGHVLTVRRRVYFYYLPPLPEVRAHWDKAFGGPYTWLHHADDQADLAPEPDDRPF